MHKCEGIDPFIIGIQEIWDHLAAVGEAPQDLELVCLALNSVFEDWEIFVQGILRRDALPRWNRIWSDLQQEDMKHALVNTSISGNNNKGSKGVEEDNVAVASKGPSQGQGSRGEKKNKKDLSKVKCLRCGEFGHYSTQCPQRKKDKQEKKYQAITSTGIDKLSSRLEEDFAMCVAIPLGVRWGDLELQSQGCAEIWEGSIEVSIRWCFLMDHYLATGAYSIQWQEDQC